jgi:hypothetical protein
MDSTAKPDGDELQPLWDVHLQELQSMSDIDVLDGVDIAKFRTDRIQFLASAQAEAGRRRLAAARAKLDAANPVGAHDLAAVPVAQAREFLRKVANDPQFTLAARGLDELSEQDLLRMYAQLIKLGAKDPSSERN